MALAINQDFNPWTGSLSPDGLWQINGPWYGTGGNYLLPSLATFTTTYPGQTDTGFLNLTIPPSTNPLEGAEIQTTQGYGYGEYEVRMMPSAMPGGVASFFLIGAPNYTQPEFDIEFLLGTHSQVTFTNHPGSGTTYYNLGFDPTAAFHTYGILWTPGPTPGTATVADLVDGVIVHSETSSAYVVPANGEYIMMNTWSGNANFGGGPPTQNSTSTYDWVHFTPYNPTLPPPPPPPTISSFSPDTNGVDTTSTINLTGKAEANSTVTVFDGSTNLGTKTVDTSGNWTFTENNAANGNHSFTATDTDANGTSAVSSPPFVVAVNVSSPPPPSNLVTNGSFETGDFSGWQLTGSNSIVTAAEQGSYAAGLGGKSGHLSQTLQTVAGQQYILDFWLANVSGGGSDNFSAVVGGQTLFQENHAPTQPYTEHQVAFTATGTSTLLQFNYRNGPSDWHLDNIVVETVGSTMTSAATAHA